MNIGKHVNFKGYDAYITRFVRRTHYKKKAKNISCQSSPYKNTNTDIKLLIYKQFLRRLFLYAFPIWFNVSRQQIRAKYYI